MKPFTTKKIALVAMMATLVFVASVVLQIQIPTVLGNTRLHMGNVLCLLSGLLLGPTLGGLAAGTGSMLYDLTNPLYFSSAPTTFLFKFFMAWICGRIAQRSLSKKNIVFASLVGAFSYVALYLIKSFISQLVIYQMPLNTIFIMLLQKGSVSLVNAVISVIVVVPLSSALLPLFKNLD